MKKIICFLSSIVLIAADYLIKAWAYTELRPVGKIDIIPDVLSLTYHENYGAAFGILQNKQIFLVGVTSIIMLGIVVAVIMDKVKGNLLLTATSLVLAGGVGNLIDRVVRGFVVDYIYFEPINFPIFNFADCCVVIGTGLVMIYILFIDSKLQKENAAMNKEEVTDAP